MAKHTSLLLVAGCATALAAAEPRNLAPNGDMEAAGGNGSVRDWGGRQQEESGNRLLRLSPGGSAVTRVPLQGIRAVRFTCRMRCMGVAEGGVAVRLDFLDKAGQVVRPGPAYPRPAIGEPGWQKVQARAVVPPGAVTLAVAPMVAQAAGGTCDVDDVQVVPMDPKDIPDEERHGGMVLVDAGRGPAPALRVDGARLVDAGGQAAWLQGVAVPGPDSPALLPAVATGGGKPLPKPSARSSARPGIRRPSGNASTRRCWLHRHAAPGACWRWKVMRMRHGGARWRNASRTARR